MIDHMTLKVTDVGRAKRFYVEALKPLGYKIIMEFPEGVGLGVGGKPDFWIAKGEPAPKGIHIAFASPDRKTVDAFYKAAIAAGGRDNGPPGIRAHYHPNYYGAFVYDPEGNNTEAVCHRPEP